MRKRIQPLWRSWVSNVPGGKPDFLSLLHTLRCFSSQWGDIPCLMIGLSQHPPLTAATITWNRPLGVLPAGGGAKRWGFPKLFQTLLWRLVLQVFFKAQRNVFAAAEILLWLLLKFPFCMRSFVSITLLHDSKSGTQASQTMIYLALLCPSEMYWLLCATLFLNYKLTFSVKARFWFVYKICKYDILRSNY